ncbi:hypothetical protein BV133_2148 [Blastochloris viridis]|uniref:Uncharacterized protein n=1 Tax=Blastochloris viridis TaxID=1079 RepID=A0A182D4B1_BLAVI|nr:hypothetical protein BV133_2148 [Blastochloris viridis]
MRNPADQAGFSSDIRGLNRFLRGRGNAISTLAPWLEPNRRALARAGISPAPRWRPRCDERGRGRKTYDLQRLAEKASEGLPFLRRTFILLQRGIALASQCRRPPWAFPP